MKLFLSLILLIAANVATAQITIINLESDPHRAVGSGLRNGREEATVEIDFEDALKLPFFEDFTSAGPSIEQITTTEGAPAVITTFQPHGFITPTEIVVSQMKGQDTADYLNGRWYAKSVDKFAFQLFKDAAATDPVLGRGRIVNDDKIGNYTTIGFEYSINPDPFKWVKSNSVYVNNRFAINPPSKNTATFDGLDARGERRVVSISPGWADTLTSRKIDLSSLRTQEDNAHLSFWWQAGGVGDRPELEDLLKLEFKNRRGTWDEIKRIRGGQSVEKASQFIYELIKVDTSYFHSSFQFRFANFGRRDGNYDIWHLDYVLLDKNRDTSRFATNEGALVAIQHSALKDYSAMPINQFNAASLSNEVSVSIRNISNSPRTFNLPFTLALDNTVLARTDLRSGSQSALNGQEFRELTGTFALTNPNFSIPTKKAVLKYTVDANFSDPASQRINLLRNNTDSTFTSLDDYFAYDDGTSEDILKLEQYAPRLLNQAVLVMKIVLNTRDTLTDIDLNFPTIQGNLAPANQRLRIKVYDDNNGIPGAAIDNGKDTIRIQQESDVTKLEQFRRHPLDFPLDLAAGTYYVGFQHAGTTTISSIGLDKNSSATGKHLYRYSDTARWTVNPFGGAWMIRPVFKAGKITTGTVSIKGTLSCDVYPNPSTGEIFIEGDVSFANLYDVSGKLIQSEQFNPNESKTIGNSTLSPGFYFLHLENENLKAIKKVVIIK